MHYRASAARERRLEPGTLYLVDSGAQYLDGTTDVTRTVAIGTPSPEMRDRFTRVLKGHIALALCRFPRGTSGSQLDALARRALWEVGLDYDHGTGHGVGSYLGVHEGPQRISKLPSTQALLPGMVVSNEPGYYKTDAYGIRIENLVVVIPVAADGAERELLGFETLTLAAIDRALVEPRSPRPRRARLARRLPRPGLRDADAAGRCGDGGVARRRDAADQRRTLSAVLPPSSAKLVSQRDGSVSAARTAEASPPTSRFEQISTPAGRSSTRTRSMIAVVGP